MGAAQQRSGHRTKSPAKSSAWPQDKYNPRRLPLAIQKCTPHQLRHSFCTMLYRAGTDVMTARDQMGHKSITVTGQIYTHLGKVYKRHRMDKLDACPEAKQA